VNRWTIALFINIQTSHQVGTHIRKFRILCRAPLIHIRLRSELNSFSIFREIGDREFAHEVMSVIWRVERW